MQSELSAADLRLWARQCEEQAKDARTSGDERDQLLKMRASLLSLAETKDWLEGKRPQTPRYATQGLQSVSFHL